LAWATGVVQFPRGSVPSPWYRAWQQLQAGDSAAAEHVVRLDLADTEPVNWWPPDAAPDEALAAVLAVLRPPLPQGRPYSAYVLSGALLRVGRHEEAAHYAAAAFNASRQPMLAVHVARAAAAMGNTSTAYGWLKTASQLQPETVMGAVQAASEFDPYRNDPGFTAALTQ
jgi:hypothetical protein